MTSLAYKRMFSGRVNLKQIEEKTTPGGPGAEMSIY